MQVNNIIPKLYPAFNRDLLEIESGNYLKEKYNYILDILTDKTTQSIVLEAFAFGYSGLTLMAGGIGTSQYTPGDYVLVRTVSATTDYSGIYRVVDIPTDSAIVLDTPFTNLVTGAVIEVYKIFRNKLPANPQGKAIFNVNGYAVGQVGHDFALDNVSAFNIPNSFDRLIFLPSEEYYQNLTYQTVQNNGGFAELQSVSGTLFIGQTVEIKADNILLNLYNGIFQVKSISGNNATLNRAFAGPIISTGQIITLPKVPVWYKDYADLSDEKLIFNGALAFPGILDFDGDDYDVSTFLQAPFLTTAPPGQKIKLDQRAYTQFYQSINTTATQWAIDVIDENGAPQQYIVNFNCTPDNLIGLAVGTYDLNQIDPLDFDTLPARALPVIRCNDISYCIYLWGENLCNIQNVQTTNFSHPYGTVLNSLTWAQQQATSYEIEVISLDIGGVPQAVTPTGNTYSQATVLAQAQEEIYSNEIALQTALTVQSTLAYGSGLSSGHWLDINFSFDFELIVRVKLNTLVYGAGSTIDVYYNWNTLTCTATYKILNGAVKPWPFNKFEFNLSKPLVINLPGFIGLGSVLTSPDALSEKLCFNIDYTPYAYSGARVLFQDRLGSFIGYNFNLKRYRRIETSSDGFERDVYAIDGIDSITRGFETIQNSYAEEWDLLTDYISEADAKYLEECYTSPNIFIQYEGEVLPAVIKPKTQTAQEKQNSDLRQIGITLRVSRTQYTQRN